MTVGKRIEQALSALDKKLPWLAEVTGVPYPTLAGLVNGDQKTTTQIAVLARALRVNPLWLQTGKGQRDSGVAEEAPEYGWSDIRGYAQAAGLGEGAEANEYAETHKLKFKANSLRRKGLQAERLAVFYGKGDSMLPRIRSGDAILFDHGDIKPIDGAVYVVMWKGEYYAKRAEILDDAVYFRTDNANGDHAWMKPKRMDAKRDPIQVIGRVRWIGSWED